MMDEEIKPIPKSSYPIVYCDSKGRQMVAMPDGATIPYVKMTRVTQETEDVMAGYCTVFASFYARIASPDEAKSIEDKYTAARSKHPTGGV